MLAETLLILVKIVAIIFGFVMLIGSLLTFVERKQSAWIQNRVGPNRANFSGIIRWKNKAEFKKTFRLGGVIHFLADGLKMLTKEDIIPRGANKTLHTIAPALALFPAMVIFAVIPFMDHYCVGGQIMVVDHQDVCLTEAKNYFTIADLDVGFLYIFAIASISVYAAAIAGWASNSKFSLLGGLRASAQMVSYEVPLGLSVIGVLMIHGTLNLNEIARGQGELLFGYIPAWGILLQPLGFLVFFTSAIAETKRAPFNVPEGESEIVAGYITEYSSMKFAIMTLSEFVGVVFVAAISATLFLGGWQVPFLYGDGFHAPSAIFFPITGLLLIMFAGYFFVNGQKRQDGFSMAIGAFIVLNGLLFLSLTVMQENGIVELPYWLVVGLRIGAMVIKVLILCWLQLMIRWTVPMFRYDQIMHLGWKILLPVSLINLVVTAILLPVLT